MRARAHPHQEERTEKMPRSRFKLTVAAGIMVLAAAPALMTTTGQARTAASAAHAVTGLARTTRSTTTPVKHVIVIDMENHSFDNVFGFWCDAHSGRCPDGGMPASV